jgi:hypothetical protein
MPLLKVGDKVKVQNLDPKQFSTKNGIGVVTENQPYGVIVYIKDSGEQIFTFRMNCKKLYDMHRRFYD